MRGQILALRFRLSPSTEVQPKVVLFAYQEIQTFDSIEIVTKFSFYSNRRETTWNTSLHVHVIVSRSDHRSEYRQSTDYLIFACYVCNCKYVIGLHRLMQVHYPNRTAMLMRPHW